MQQISKAQFKDSNFRYREWYQGCKGKLESQGSITVEDKLEGLEATEAWVAEPKRDGIWCIAFFDALGVEFFSRTCERKPYSLDKLNIPSLHGCALIGELGYGSQESIRRRKQLGIDFMDVYDVAVFDYRVVTDLDDEHRRGVMETLLTRAADDNDPAILHFLRTPRWTKGFKKEYQLQPEGLILKPRHGGFAYTPGRKVNHWIKVKKDHTVDMVIMGWVESDAETKRGKGMIEFIRCGMYVNGELKELVHVGSMTHELSKDIYANWKKYEMKVVELKHFGQFRSGALRHPSVFRMRDDKRAEDCIFDPEQVSPKNFKCVSLGDHDADTVS